MSNARKWVNDEAKGRKKMTAKQCKTKMEIYKTANEN